MSETESGKIQVALASIAYARSGDKGRNANIGLIAHSEAGFEKLLEQVTETRVLEHFAHTPVTRVVRYEMPNLGALNFMLYDVLGKGGSQTLAIDAQGKALGQVLLTMPIEVSADELVACSPQIVSHRTEA